MSDSESSDYEGFFCADLFVNEEYVTKEFDFGVITQPLLCSNAASTDHDLTGQVVWPVSAFLAWFMTAHREELAGKTVVELGAGAGLSGLVASHFADRTALTDGNEVVLKLLAKNAAATNSDKCVALELRWGEKQSVEEFEAKFPYPVDVLIGADVVCWPALVKPILLTIKYLLLKAKVPLATSFYCGFVCRAQSTEDLLFREAKAMGFRYERVPDSEFVPEPRPLAMQSKRELQLLVFRLDETAANWNTEVQFMDAELEQMPTAC